MYVHNLTKDDFNIILIICVLFCSLNLLNVTVHRWLCHIRCTRPKCEYQILKFMNMKRSKPLQLDTSKSFKVPRYDKFSRGTQVSTHGKNVFCQTQNMPVSATGTQTSRVSQNNHGVQTQQLHVVNKFVQTSSESLSSVLSNQQGSCTSSFCSCNQNEYLLQDLDNLVGLVADSNQWDKPFVMSLIENFLFALK